MRTTSILVLSAMTAALVACGGGEPGSVPDPIAAEEPPAAAPPASTSPEPGVAPAPAAAPAPKPAEPPEPKPDAKPTRMYVADASGMLFVYALPLTAGSTPLATVGPAAGLVSPRNVAISPAHDRIFVADALAQKVFGFDLPLTNASTPVVTIASPSPNAPHGVAFDGAGNLWISKFAGALSRYDAPITSASSVAMALTVSDGAYLYDVVFDQAHDTLHAAGLKGLVTWVAPKDGDAPTFTMQSGTRYSALTMRADGAIFASEFSSNKVVSFHPPFSAATPRVERTLSGAGFGIGFLEDGSLLRSNVSANAFVKNDPPTMNDLLTAPSLTVLAGGDVTDPRGFAFAP